MKKTLVYIAVLAMIMTLFAVPVSAEEAICPECSHSYLNCSCFECCCLDPPCLGDPKTQGYWKNHTDLWEGREDLPLGINGSGDSTLWLNILNTPSNAGPWYQLAKQYIAAWLNLEENGGEVYYNVEEGHGADVYGAIAEAERILNATIGDKDTIDREYALYLKDFLDLFNNYDSVE